MTITLQGGFGMPYAQRDKEHTLILDREDRSPSVSALVNNKSTGVTNRNMGHLRVSYHRKVHFGAAGAFPDLGLWASVTPVILAPGRELGCCAPSDSHTWLWAAVEILFLGDFLAQLSFGTRGSESTPRTGTLAQTLS